MENMENSESIQLLSVATELAMEVASLAEVLQDHLNERVEGDKIRSRDGLNLSFSYSLMGKLCERVSKIISDNTP